MKKPTSRDPMARLVEDYLNASAHATAVGELKGVDSSEFAEAHEVSEALRNGIRKMARSLVSGPDSDLVGI